MKGLQERSRKIEEDLKKATNESELQQNIGNAPEREKA